jgi:hypothetical protein
MQTLDKQEQEVLQPEGISREDYRQLVRRLKKIERRLRLQEAVRLLPSGLLAGGVIGLGVAIYSRVIPSFTMEQVFMVAIPAVIIGLLGVVLYAFLRPHKLINTARRADYALGLKERLSTAIEGYHSTDWQDYAVMGARQFNDAHQSLEGLKASKSLPLRMRRRDGLLAVAIIPLLAAALLLPNPFSDQVKENQAIKEQIEQQAQKIEELKQHIEKENPLAATKNDPKAEELLKQLEQLKKDLLDKSNNKDEALAALDKAQQELEKLSDPAKSTQEKAAIESLAKTLNNSDATKTAGQALQQNDPNRFDNAAKELEKLASDKNAMQQLQKDPNQAQQLSNALAKDAENFKNSNPEMADKLQQLSNALANNNLKQDSKAAEQGLKDVAQQLRQSGQNQQTNQQLQAAQAQLQKSEAAINQTAQQGQSGEQNAQNNSNQTITNIDNSGEQQGDQQGNQQNQQGQQQGQQGQQNQQGQQGSGQQGSGQQGQQGQGQGQQGQQGQGSGQQGQQGSGQQSDQQGQQGQQGQGSGQQGDQGEGQQESDSKGGSRAGKGSSDAIYQDPTKRNTNGSQVNVAGQDGQGPSSNQNVNGGNPSGQASVPYSDVIEQYQQQAAQQLDKNYIPLTLKDMIKQYFDDLNKKDK